ncbi:hypothetical protein HMPREF1620_00774, partial [Escherichia coli 909945-2]
GVLINGEQVNFMRLLDQNRLSSQILLIPSLLEKFNSEII